MIDRNSERLKAQQQADIARSNLQSQYDVAVSKAKGQGIEASGQTKASAEANRGQIRKSIGAAEVELQKQAQYYRDALQKSQQRQYAGLGITKVVMPDVSTLSQQQNDLNKLRVDVDKIEVSNFENITGQLDSILADLSKQRDEALKQIQGIYDSNVAEIDKAYQQQINQRNLDELDKTFPSVPSDAIKLDNGEYISRLQWEPLNLAQQNYLKAYGIDKFNIRMAEYNSRITVGDTSNLIKLDTGEYVDNSLFAELKPNDWEYLKTQGVDKFNQRNIETPTTELINPLETAIATSGQVDIGKAADNIWKAVTPWAEENGETFQDYVKNFPDYLAHFYDEPTQDELAQSYEAFEQSPLWYKIIFNGGVINPVMKLDNGKYGVIRQGEAPMISFAGSGVKVAQTVIKNLKPLLTVAPVEIGLSDAAYLRFLNARVANPDLSVEGFKALDYVYDLLRTKGGATFAQQKAISMGEKFKGVLQPGEELIEDIPSVVKTTSGIVDDAVDPYYMGGRPLTENWYQEVLDVISQSKSTKQIVPKVDKALTTVGKVAVNSKISVDDAATILINHSAITPALAVQPAATLNIIINTTPILRSIALATINPKIADAITENQSQGVIQGLAQAEVVNLTNTVNKIVADKDIVTELEPIIKTSMQNIVEVKPTISAQSWTGLEVSPKVGVLTYPQVNTQQQTITEPQVATKQQVQTQPLTKTQIKTQIENRIKTEQIYKEPIPNERNIPRYGGGEFVLELPTGKEIITAAQYESIIAWKQGKLRQGTVYKMAYPPTYNLITTFTPIKGVTYNEGLNSAYRSFIAKGYNLPKYIKWNMGAVDPTFTNDRGKGKLGFVRDNKYHYVKNKKKSIQPRIISL